MKRWGLACLMLVGFASEAKVEVDWRQESGGAVLAFTIRSANFADAPRDWETDCGGLLSRPLCSVSIVIGLGILDPVYTFNLPQKNRQKASALVQYWSGTLPVSGAIADWDKWVKANGGQPPCILFYVGGKQNNGWFANSCTGSVTVPPVDPPEPPLSCSLNGTLSLRHGVLAAKELAGHQTETRTTVTCTRAAQVRIRVLDREGGGSDIVTLQPGGALRARLSVEGRAGAGGVLLDIPGPGGRTVTFSSELLTSGTPAAGEFFASGVALLEVI